MIDNKIFYSLQKIMSYNAFLNFIIGERGVGKSYSAKKFVVNRFLKKGKQFVYLRRYKTEVKQAMSKNGNPIFFEQIKYEFPEHTLTNKTDTMYIDDKLCGFAMPLSVANILKSSTYEQVDTIIFDEFIIDKGCYHYLQNEVEQLLDVIETVARLRDIRVIFLGNAISITNPYFTYFNLSLPYNSDVKTFKDGLILVNYIKNLEYREVKKSTRFGRLVEGTKYGKYAIDNEFLRDSKSFIKKKDKNAKFYFILCVEGKEYGVWNDFKSGLIYISNDIDPNCPVKFSILPNDHNENTLLIKCRTSPYFRAILEHYRLARLCFENQSIKNVLMEVINRYITY